jgi:hypothetical protein
MVYILELKINKTKQTKQMSSILVSLFHLFAHTVVSSTPHHEHESNSQL